MKIKTKQNKIKYLTHTKQFCRSGEMAYDWEPKNLLFAGFILCMRPANERRRYIVTPSPFGWAHSTKWPMGLDCCDCAVIEECTVNLMRKVRHLEIRHYNDAIMSLITSQITSLTIVYSIVFSDADQRKHQSSAVLAFVCGEFTGDRWIPRTNGQLRGKCFHLMTSSCVNWIWVTPFDC